MKIRGQRECKDCGSRWSYYETGSVACPDCGSLHSVGVDDRQLHTAGPADLDLQEATAAVGTESIDAVAGLASDAAATFLREYGFVHAGELRPLDEQFVAAAELRHVGTELARTVRVTDAEEAYLLALLEGAKAGRRPQPADVPDSLRSARGLAVAAAVDAYRRDVLRYLDEHPDGEARRVLGRIDDHRKRVEALDGAVSPATADALLAAARAVGTYLLEDEATLDAVDGRLDEMDPDD